jgi:hypothetical protein
MTAVEHLLGVTVVVVLYFAFGIAITIILKDVFTNNRKDSKNE